MKPRWKFLSFLAATFACSLLMMSCKQQPPPSTEMPITTSSEEARQLFVQGRDHLENLETTQAATLFDQAIAKDPNFALAYVWRSGSGGGADVAQKNREKAKSLIPNVTQGERLLILMNEASANGQTALEKIYLDSLLAMFPKDKHLKWTAGIYYRGLLDYKTAVKYYAEAVAIDSTYATPYNNLGYDNVELGNMEAAEKAFKTYIRLLPGRPNPLDSYAEFLRMQGRYDESIAQYKKVLEASPSFVSSLIGLGDCYIFMGNTEKARESYKECSEKGTQINQKANGYFWTAVSYIHEGKIPQALKAFEEYGNFTQNAGQLASAVSAIVYQGHLAVMFGKPSEGLKKYDEAMQPAKLAPLREQTRENFRFWSNYWYTIGNAEAKKFDKAKGYLESFARGVERRGNPGEKDALAECEGYLALMSGRLDEAAAKFEPLPKTPSSLYLRGLAYHKKGDKENARKMAEEIMKWRTNSLDLAVARAKAKSWQ